MPVNPNLTKWVLGSIAKYFQPIATNLGITYYVEGLDNYDSEKISEDRVEVRIYGPEIKEISAGSFKINITINIILSSFVNQTGNKYTHFERCGEFVSAMSERIPITKIGGDGSLIGCLTYKRTKDTAVKQFHFGLVTKDDLIKQSEFDCNYEMEIT